MSDRDRIAAALLDAGPPLNAETEQEWALSVADALIAAGATMPVPPCPEWVRFGGKQINCRGTEGHEGECW